MQNIYLIISIFMVVVVITSIHFFIEKNKYKVNFLSEKALNNFIESSFKKRKNVVLNMKNRLNMVNRKLKYSYLPINLKKIEIGFDLLESYKKQRNLLFFEKFVFDNMTELKLKMDKINKLNFNEKYRAVCGKILILEIAKTYVFLSLSRTNFDPVAHFKRLTNEYKFYKKEIKILPHLISYFLLLSLKTNLLYAENIRNIIEKYSKVKKITKKEISKDEVVYSLAKYNKHYIEFKLKLKLDEQLATYNFSKELLQLNSEVKAILLWLQVL